MIRRAYDFLQSEKGFSIRNLIPGPVLISVTKKNNLIIWPVNKFLAIEAAFC